MANLFVKCPNCGTTHFFNILSKTMQVCPECEYHHKLDAPTRLKYTVDKGSFEEFDKKLRSDDPLDFPEYVNKLKVAQKKRATLGFLASYLWFGICIVIMDTRFIMASMGLLLAKNFIEYATNNGCQLFFCGFRRLRGRIYF